MKPLANPKCLIAMAACAALPVLASNWPSIRPASMERVITTQDFVHAYVDDTNGAHRYLLECKSGDAPEDPAFNYSGLLHCRLTSTASNKNASLLFESTKTTADWEGRGRFTLHDVLGTCGQTAEWGATRTFRLRGMALTIQIDQVAVPKASDAPVRMRFRYEVVADPAATSRLAAPANSAEPVWFSTTKPCTDDPSTL